MKAGWRYVYTDDVPSPDALPGLLDDLIPQLDLLGGQASRSPSQARLQCRQLLQGGGLVL